MLSTFESRLLDRHLRTCADCRFFAAGAVEQTRLLRAAPLERLEQPLTGPVAVPRQRARALAVTFAGALAAAAAAAALIVQPSGSSAVSSAYLTGPHHRMLTEITSNPDLPPPAEPASAHLNVGAVRGVFSLPA
jgi:hypothetical protein